MNIVEGVRTYLDSETVTSIADAIAEPPQQVRAAIAGAVPALLAAFADRASHPASAPDFQRELKQVDLGVAEKFVAAAQSSRVFGLMEHGAQPFTLILGRETSDSLARAISGFSGLSVASSHSLLSLLTPLTLAVIARLSRPTSASGLATFMESQRRLILAALPPGLVDYLKQVPALRSRAFQPALYDTGAAATSTDDDMQDYSNLPRQEIVSGLHGDDTLHQPRETSNEPRAEASQQGQISNPARWAIPFLFLLALLGALAYLLSPTNPDALRPMAARPIPRIGDEGAVPAAARMNPEPSAPYLGDLSFMPDPKLAAETSSALEALRQTLVETQSMKALSAPTIERSFWELASRIGRVAAAIDLLPMPQRQRFAQQLAPVLPELESGLQQVLTARDAAAIEPHARSILNDLRSLAAPKPKPGP